LTVAPAQLALYAGAILILFLTPGPVWVALMARALGGGFASAAPLAVGVALGDMFWPLLAIFGLSWVLTLYADLLIVMRWIAVGMFLFMGVQLIRHADKQIASDSRLMRPGAAAGFMAGIAVILANPKAILFYMGVLPGFFDLTRVTLPDIVAILLISAIIPMLGNLSMAFVIGRVRDLLSSGQALARVNRTAGVLLIIVGIIIGFSE
jgi:threonine/homoserine/homoserine lactone efflux protein